MLASGLDGQTGWEQQSATVGGESIEGAALLDSAALVSWGSTLRRWSLPELQGKILAAGPFGEGGCSVDLDKDGVKEVVTVAGTGLGTLTWFAPPSWRPERVDGQVEMHDCVEATLFGRRGFLMIHRGAQVRFYERQAPGQWSSRDIYSIYTPSYQGGLALADVDGDGLTDIYCGNYWIQSPKAFELPWRLFAINTWTEAEESATMRIALLGEAKIAVSQGHAGNARVAVFTRAEDPKQQWPARPLLVEERPSQVHGLLRCGNTLLAGERNGVASRLFAVDLDTRRSRVLASGQPVSAILGVDSRRFVSVGGERITLWTQPLRK